MMLGAGSHSAGEIYEIDWPYMTANNLPAGYIMSASSAGGSYPAYQAHDNAPNTNTEWVATSPSPAWIQIQFPSLRKASRIRTVTKYSPYSYSLAGSLNSTDWSPLLIDGAVTSAVDGVFHTITNPDAYLYYRITTAYSEQYPRLRIWEMIFSAS